MHNHDWVNQVLGLIHSPPYTWILFLDYAWIPLFESHMALGKCEVFILIIVRPHLFEFVTWQGGDRKLKLVPFEADGQGAKACV